MAKSHETFLFLDFESENMELFSIKGFSLKKNCKKGFLKKGKPKAKNLNANINKANDSKIKRK